MYNKIVPKVLTISIKSGIFIVSKVTNVKFILKGEKNND